jgi:hypothetical protein
MSMMKPGFFIFSILMTALFSTTVFYFNIFRFPASCNTPPNGDLTPFFPAKCAAKLFFFGDYCHLCGENMSEPLDSRVFETDNRHRPFRIYLFQKITVVRYDYKRSLIFVHCRSHDFHIPDIQIIGWFVEYNHIRRLIAYR